MSRPYLENLPLSREERQQLAQIDVDSPAALLAAVHAAPEAFRSFFGDEKTDALIHVLNQHVSPDDRAAAAAPVPHYGLGARVDAPAPHVPLRSTQDPE